MSKRGRKKGDNRGSSRGRYMGQERSHSNWPDGSDNRLTASLTATSPTTNPPTWAQPQSIRAFFPIANQSSEIDPTNEGACSINNAYSNCWCTCHHPPNDTPKAHLLADHRSEYTQLDHGPESTQLDCSNTSIVSTDSIAILYNMAKHLESNMDEMPLPVELTIPGVIPANPTNHELFELMTKTQIMLASQLNAFSSDTTTRLQSLEDKASTSIAKATELSSEIITNAAKIKAVENKNINHEAETGRLDNLLKDALSRITELEHGVVSLDRENRDKNIRILNIPEEKEENCMIKIATMIKANSLIQHAENIPLNDVVKLIENAHRIGKLLFGRTRHVLVKFHSSVSRDEIMRTFKSRGRKTSEGFEIKDDLAREAKKTHTKYAPYMKRMYEINGARVFFKHGNFRLNGVWYSEEEFKKLIPTS